MAALLNTKVCVVRGVLRGSQGVQRGDVREERRSVFWRYCNSGRRTLIYLAHSSSMAAPVLPLTCLVLLSLVSVSSQIQWFRFLWVPETTSPAPAVTTPATTTTAPEESTAPVFPASRPQPTEGSSKARAKKPLRMWKSGECWSE